jgi:hypothetical protein
MFSKRAAYIAAMGDGAVTLGGLSLQGKEAKGVSSKFVCKRF